MSSKYLRQIAGYPEKPTLTGAEFFPINQPDTTGALGQRTVKASLENLYTFTKTYTVTQNFLSNTKIDFSSGLKGNGSTNNPFSLDTAILDKILIPGFAVPISQIGDVWGANNGDLNIAQYVENNQRCFKINTAIKCFFSGKNLTIEPQVIRFSEADLIGYGVEYSTRPVYIYLEYINDTLKLFPSSLKYPENYNFTCIGRIQHRMAVNTGETMMTAYWNPKVDATAYIRIGRYRLSDTKRGAAIPVSAANPYTQQFTLWE